MKSFLIDISAFFREGNILKKLITILIITIMLVTSILIRPFESFSAAAPIIRIAAGSTAEKIMYGMAEKAGLKYASKSAMQKARERWNMELYEQLKEQTTPVDLRQRLDDFSNTINKAEVIPIPEKPGYGKVVLNSVLFLTGLDIILEAYNIFKDAYEENKFVDGMTEAISEGTYVKYFPGYEIRIAETGEYYGIPWTRYNMYPINGPSYDYIRIHGGYGHKDGEPLEWYHRVIREWPTYYSIETHFSYYHPEYGRQKGHFSYQEVYKKYLTNEGYQTVIPITETDIPNITQVPEPLRPLVNPGLEPYTNIDNLPETVEIIIPINEPYPEPSDEPLNTPDDLFSSEPSPDPLPVTPPDDSIPDNCGELKLDLKSIELFTTKFPFSIPWDIYRALEAFFGKMGSEEPRFVLSFISDGVVLEIPEFIKEWIPLVRTLILFIFDISIIYALYRWFGGAS